MEEPQRPPSPNMQAFPPRPVSPAITQVPSRGRKLSPCDPERRSRRDSTSPGPPRPSVPAFSSQHSPIENMAAESPERGEAGLPIEQPVQPFASISAPPGILPQLLPYDVSQYSEPAVLTAARMHTPARTSLSELAHLIKRQRYQEQRLSQSRIQLHRWLVAAGLSARLLRCGELAYRTQIDYFRSERTEDRKAFATLYNAWHDVRSSCDATSRYAALEAAMELSRVGRPAEEEDTASFSTFMHEIPQKIRSEILAFLCEIRTNPDFLAARIATLSQQEVIALASFRPAPDPESVMSAKGPGITRKPSLPTIPNPVERLLSFQRHDPLSALIYTCFANSYGPESTEDQRRTDAWATTIARLLRDAHKGTEPLMKSVLDAWARMRDWPAKTNMELFLMKVLQDGQFLVDKAEQIKSAMGEKELRYEAEVFFDRAIKQLFDVIDGDDSAGGIPEGVWEIGTALMKKLSHKTLRQAAEQIIILRWFLASFLRNALVYPENHGIMLGYHISQAARDKILKPIADGAQKQASAVFFSFSRPDHVSSVIPEVKKHMENLLARLRYPRVSGRPILLPAKAVTSPRETSEVQPFLIISPADIVTLVTALFPDRRPPSSHTDVASIRRGPLSAASSISNISLPFNWTSQSGDNVSVISVSASSVASDTTSREPLLNPSEQSVNSEEITDQSLFDQPHSEHIRPAATEDYGRSIRTACSEMMRIIGPDAASGSCHPCAERWAVLFITHNGAGIRTKMQEDVDDDDTHDEDSSDSESDEDDGGLAIPGEADYGQLKERICRLVCEYELPKNLAPESESKLFTNRAGTQKIRPRKGLRRTVPAQRLEDMANAKGSPMTRRHHAQVRSANETDDSRSRKTSGLWIMLDAAYNQCLSRNKHVDARFWWNTLDLLARLSSSSLSCDGYAPLLNLLARGPRDAISRTDKAIEKFEAWFTWLRQSKDRYEENVKDMMHGFDQLRDKMWFRTAVLTSASYEEARTLAIALKMMGQPAKQDEDKALQAYRPRPLSRAAPNFLLRTETQVMDLIAMPNNRAGPNKLVDDHADKTAKWLKAKQIENFCSGEERIHRLCLEISNLINKLVGDNVLEAPVLWSSDLYRRDKDILDSGRQKGDLWLTGVGTTSVGRYEDSDRSTSRPPSRAHDLAQYPSQSSMRSLSTRASQMSLNSSSQWSSASRGLNLMDAPATDYFGAASPATSIDTGQTFWSPLQPSAPHGKTGKDLRPLSATSSKGTVMIKSSSMNQEKHRFLEELKQSLLGLLLSDLGTLVFQAGSETDLWFNGEIAADCLHKKIEAELKRKAKLARKKSMRSLKSASREQRIDTSDRKASGGREDGHHSALEHPSPSEATSKSAGLAALKEFGLLEYPFDDSYKQLLAEFATVVSPWAKLKVLYDLKLLVSEAVAKSSRHVPRRETLPAVPQSPDLESSTHTMQIHSTDHEALSPRRDSRASIRFPGTDVVLNVLQTLFQDPDLRPKTLFRDLQYIAAFIPSHTLYHTEHGKAFCDVASAVLELKVSVCRYMVEMADEIVIENTQSRTAAQAPPPSPTSPSGGAHRSPSRWNMADAAQMYIITAKEGDPAAERELAIFYLTHPELLPRTLQPFSRPREIFKESLVGRKVAADAERSDPMTMCVAQHWMELSKKGGDELAMKYLRARDDMERIP